MLNLTAPYLGVNISSNLTWNHHIKTTAAKANKTLGFVKRNLKGASKKAKILAYQTLVRPKLEYCSTVWAPHHQQSINSLEMVQRCAARFVEHKYGRESVSVMLQNLCWEELLQRRIRAQVLMLYKINNALVCIPATQLITGRYNTRSRARGGYRQIEASTDSYKYSFFPTAIRAWNTLPQDITTIQSLDGFRSALSQVTLDVSRIY